MKSTRRSVESIIGVYQCCGDWGEYHTAKVIPDDP